MKTILWAQNEDAMIKDTFVINDIITSSSDTPEEMNAFSDLTQASNSLRLTPKVRRMLNELKGFSEQANFSIVNNTYYIQGCFEEKDNVGRNMPYMFLTNDCCTFDDAVLKLKQASSLIGRSCIDKDLDLMSTFAHLDSSTIEKAVSKLYKKKDLKIIIGVICIIIIGLVLWKLVN
ncbi:MAG: hypothetical protein HDS52_02210 [Barnesiella sp.]|nr:hypothetical protein [Barnesiella sp.]